MSALSRVLNIRKAGITKKKRQEIYNEGHAAGVAYKSEHIAGGLAYSNYAALGGGSVSVRTAVGAPILAVSMGSYNGSWSASSGCRYTGYSQLSGGKLHYFVGTVNGTATLSYYVGGDAGTGLAVYSCY